MRLRNIGGLRIFQLVVGITLPLTALPRMLTAGPPAMIPGHWWRARHDPGIIHVPVTSQDRGCFTTGLRYDSKDHQIEKISSAEFDRTGLRGSLHKVWVLEIVEVACDSRMWLWLPISVTQKRVDTPKVYIKGLPEPGKKIRHSSLSLVKIPEGLPPEQKVVKETMIDH